MERNYLKINVDITTVEMTPINNVISVECRLEHLFTYLYTVVFQKANVSIPFFLFTETFFRNKLQYKNHKIFRLINFVSI